MQNAILTANVAKAKLVYYKQKDTFKIVIAFNVHKVIDKTGEVKWKFPVQKQCNYHVKCRGYSDACPPHFASTQRRSNAAGACTSLRMAPSNAQWRGMFRDERASVT